MDNEIIKKSLGDSFDANTVVSALGLSGRNKLLRPRTLNELLGVCTFRFFERAFLGG